MKAHVLRFGKAMSAALFVLLLSIVGMKNALAQTQVATLQHDDDIDVFYGMNAFVEAHNAAQTGDIITLSSGTFVPTTITKAITLRGAGCAVDSVAGTFPTIIPSELRFNIEDTTSFVTVEGILFQQNVTLTNNDLYNPKFIKCHFAGRFLSNTYNDMYNASFINCYFTSTASFCNAHSSTLINCAIWELDSCDTYLTIYNSYIAIIDWSLRNVFAYNSIIDNYYNYNEPADSYSTFYNCIGIKNGHDSSIFQYQSNSTNIEVDSMDDVFSENGFYVLKNEIASSFLGNDGTQVGIYGGFMPYSNRPTYMVIKRCNVANKSTIDGKLSVDIEVVTEE